MLTRDGVPITIQGDTSEGSLQTINGKKLRKLFRASKGTSQGFICMMTGVNNAIGTTTSAAVPSPLKQVIEEFHEVFAEPVGLPPIRQYDHKIPLLQGSQPVNQRSYRVPYIQKSEIEQQIKEMLKTWIIQESTSPYASPIILVKKKDGS